MEIEDYIFVFQSHRCVHSAVSLNYHYKGGGHTRFVDLSPTLNRSSVIQRFIHSDAIEIHNGIIFDFYMRLPHLYVEDLVL